MHSSQPNDEEAARKAYIKEQAEKMKWLSKEELEKQEREYNEALELLMKHI